MVPDTGARGRALPLTLGRRRFLAFVLGTLGLGGALPDGLVRSDAAAQEIVPVGQENTLVALGAGSRYFAETGHNLAEPFNSHWDQAGGDSVLGMPLSEERYTSGVGGVLQSFRNLVLLYDPTQAPPFDVRGEPLGKSAWAQLVPSSAAQPATACLSASCQFFPETGHTLSEPFATFWNDYGGAQIFGPPVSEPFEDPGSLGATVQVFESAVLENRAGTVALRPMGQWLAERDGLLTDPAFQPAPPTGGSSFLVRASDGLRLRSAPDSAAAMVTVLPDNSEFIAAPGDQSDWVPGYAESRSGWVSAAFLSDPPTLPKLQPADWNLSVWQGATLEETNIRKEPTTKSSAVKSVPFGEPVTVTAWVKGKRSLKARTCGPRSVMAGTSSPATSDATLRYYRSPHQRMRRPGASGSTSV